MKKEQDIIQEGIKMIAEETKPGACCSFCLKPKGRSRILICGSHDALICDECIEEIHSMLKDGLI